MENKMYHPKLGLNEVFVGNTNDTGEMPTHLRTLKTVRLDKEAYDIHGKLLKKSDKCVAIIMNKSDLNEYNRIMEYRSRETF